MLKQIGIWVGIVIVIILAVVGLIKLSNSASSTPPATTQAANMPKLTSADNMYGPKNSKVQLVEYGDFQCPACGAEFPIVEQLRSQYKNKVLFVYRYFPLEQVHQFALIGAQAAYAAAQQGKFWQMYVLLYKNQSTWANSQNPKVYFDTYAKQIRLNMNQYNKDYSSSQAQKVISDSETAGINAGVDATPTFFINGQKINSDVPPSYDQLKQLIDQRLQAK